MNFLTLNKDVLLQVAEEFGVDVGETPTKTSIAAALLRDGVTWEMYKESFPDVEELPDVEVDIKLPAAPARVFPQKNVLIRMIRDNYTYEIRGYRFTKKNPFLPVDEDNANYILEQEDGFRVASPREAEEFYG